MKTFNTYAELKAYLKELQVSDENVRHVPDNRTIYYEDLMTVTIDRRENDNDEWYEVQVEKLTPNDTAYVHELAVDDILKLVSKAKQGYDVLDDIASDLYQLKADLRAQRDKMHAYLEELKDKHHEEISDVTTAQEAALYQ